MADISRLASVHLDLLKEIGNIGAAHAATALSHLLKKRIDLRIPSVSLLSVAELINEHAERQIAASYIQVQGGLEGHFFMIVDAAQAEQLVKNVVPAGTDPISTIQESAYCEISNILCGSYLSALSAFLDIPLAQTPPIFARDMEGAILSEGLSELSLLDDWVILINTDLYDRASRNQFKGEFLFFPDPQSMDVIYELAEGKLSG